MTLDELFARALIGCEPEVQCVSLIFMYETQGDEMRMPDMMELESLIKRLGVDLGTTDEATWTPEQESE